MALPEFSSREQAASPTLPPTPRSMLAGKMGEQDQAGVGNSLAVQCLGLGAFTAGARVQSWSGN